MLRSTQSTSGLNVTASMVVGTGATLDYTASGTINASSVAGSAITGLIRKNGYMVTVCATGCDYATIQAALDGTTATSAQPVTILVMPGTYAECLTLDTVDSYKTIAGPGQDAATITCTSSVEQHDLLRGYRGHRPFPIRDSRHPH